MYDIEALSKPQARLPREPNPRPLQRLQYTRPWVGKMCCCHSWVLVIPVSKTMTEKRSVRVHKRC
jgi:hypothetical protein